jgi:hypothetical protein
MSVKVDRTKNSKLIYPSFLLPNGKKVIDEKCSCGHKASEHNSFLTFGQGSCKKCGCRQFTWNGWIYESDKCNLFQSAMCDESQCDGLKRKCVK